MTHDINYGNWNPLNFSSLITKNFLDDLSSQFLTFLQTLIKSRDSTTDIRIVGKKRSGKTTIAIIIINYILLLDPKRMLVCFKNKNLYNVLSKISFFHNRVVYINQINEADKYVNEGYKLVIYIDEGLIVANAKSALKKEMKELGQAFADSSHKDVILIINSQDDQIIRDLRRKSEILIYKRLSSNFILNAENTILRKYENVLKTLKKQEALLISEHFDFSCIGMLRYNVFELIPYYNEKIDEEISKNASSKSFSQSLEEEKDMINTVEQLSKEYITYYGYQNCKKKRNHKAELKFWIERQKGLEFSKTIEPYIDKINTYIIGYCNERAIFGQIEHKPIEDTTYNCKLIKDYILEQFYDSFAKKVIKLHLQGNSYKQICTKTKQKQYKFATIIQTFKENATDMLMTYLHHICKEDFPHLKYHLSYQHRTNKHFIEFDKKDYQNSKYIFLYNPKWSEYPIMYQIQPTDTKHIIISKTDCDPSKFTFDSDTIRQHILCLNFQNNDILEKYFQPEIKIIK